MQGVRHTDDVVLWAASGEGTLLCHNEDTDEWTKQRLQMKLVDTAYHYCIGLLVNQDGDLVVLGGWDGRKYHNDVWLLKQQDDGSWAVDADVRC